MQNQTIETSFLDCPTLTKVSPLDGYYLMVTFDNGEVKKVDFTPYFQQEVFQSLRDVKIFNKAHVRYGGVSWNDEIDLASASLYDMGISVK